MPSPLSADGGEAPAVRVRLPAPLYRALTDRCAVEGLSRSDAVRSAVEAWLAGPRLDPADVRAVVRWAAARLDPGRDEAVALAVLELGAALGGGDAG